VKPLSSWARRGAVVVSAALLVGSLAACSSGTGASGSSSDSTKLTIGFQSDPAALGYDPLKYSDGQREFFEGLYGTLFDLKPNGSTGPGLATSFSYNSTNTVLTLTLKQGVKFSDGSVLDAALVKANLDRRTDTALSAYSAIAPGGASEVTSVAVVSPNQVAITFKAPQPGFQNNLTSVEGMIVGKSAIANPASLSATPDGSGPYTLDKSTVKSSSYVLDKNASSVDAANYPYKTIVFKPITDPQALANALVSGQVDTTQLDASTVAFVKSKGVKVAQVGGTVDSMLTFDKIGKIVPAFGSEQVRQALQTAIDRKGLVAALHKGEIPAWNALPSASPGFTTSLNSEFAYNPAKAKKMLAAAGYPNGFTFTVIASPDTETDLQAVQKNFAAIGVTMNVKLATSTAEAFAAVQTTALGNLPLNWANPVGNMYGVFFGFANSQNAKDPQLSAATGAVAAAKSPTEEAAALKSLNERLVQSGWDMPLYELLNSQGYNSAKLAPVAFAGTNQFPLLSSFKPKK
jgi:peptide/nickel transport system substrate-binding protein